MSSVLNFYYKNQNKRRVHSSNSSHTGNSVHKSSHSLNNFFRKKANLIFSKMSNFIFASQAADMYVCDDEVKENTPTSNENTCNNGIEESSPIASPERKKQKEIVQVNDPLEESDESNLYNSSDNIMRVKSTSSSIGSCDSSNYSQQVEEGGEKKKFKMSINQNDEDSFNLAMTRLYAQEDCPVYIDLKEKGNTKTLLGSGANSDVYGLSNKIAIKVYKNKAAQRKINSEMRTLLLLKDIPNVPKFINYTKNVMVSPESSNDSQLLHSSSAGAFQRGLIMERFEGVDLFDALMNTREIKYPCPEETIMEEFLPGCLKILKNVHKVGSHRDIKLENIILKKDRKNFGDVAFIDFDTFTSNENLNMHSTRSKRVGTKAYISPEDKQFRSRGTPSDIWALGVVCLSLLGAAEVVLNHNALYRHPDSVKLIMDKVLKHLSNEYKQLLLSMFDKDCIKRPDASSLLISLNKIKNKANEAQQNNPQQAD